MEMDLLISSRPNETDHAPRKWLLMFQNKTPSVNLKPVEISAEPLLVLFLIRAILYELGLQGKLTTDQLAKKWDNLKRRYKVCPSLTVCPMMS